MKNGIFILSGWFLFNALPGVGSLLYILMGRHAPAFQYLFRQEELAALDSKFINTTDGVAIIANVVIVSYCFSSFF
ncbi:MAG: hypothetical protein ABIQ95_08355, partial [Bdellovibrionia bacterium]